jgi:NitT/TauT family transport system substrate-binding protein
VGAAFAQLSPANAQRKGQAGGLTQITYGEITKSALNWPYMIAEREGFFEGEGIKLEKVIGGNTAATAQALVAGGTDLAQMNLVQLLAANAAGADLVVVGGDSMVPIYTLIVSKDVKSYADLKGKRLAVAGPTDPLNYVLSRMLSANKLKPDEYEMIPVGGTGDRLSAITRNAASGSLLGQPYDFRALANGMNELGRSTEYVDHFQYTITGARRDWVEKHKDLVVRFLRAYVKGCEAFYNPKNKDTAIRILMEETKSDWNAAEKTYDLYQKSRKTIPQRGEVDIDGAHIVAQNWKEFGLQKKVPSVDGVMELGYLKIAQSKK